MRNGIFLQYRENTAGADVVMSFCAEHKGKHMVKAAKRRAKS